MTADDAEIIRWQLRWIREAASELTENELKWASIFEEKFLKQGFLSKKEMKIIEDIYTRRT